ncbi:MAG TPA: hypothetical protein DEB31_12025 [Clostridiales bacterium]|nr:hypothetical protein [Clostridiales bacterium]
MSPKTADESNLGLWLAVLAISGAAIAGAVMWRKAKRQGSSEK